MFTSAFSLCVPSFENPPSLCRFPKNWLGISCYSLPLKKLKQNKKGIWFCHSSPWKICEVQDINVADVNKKQSSQAIYDTRLFHWDKKSPSFHCLIVVCSSSWLVFPANLIDSYEPLKQRHVFDLHSAKHSMPLMLTKFTMLTWINSFEQLSQSYLPTS